MCSDHLLNLFTDVFLVIPTLPSLVMAQDPIPRRAAQGDLKRLQGTWQCVAMKR